MKTYVVGTLISFFTIGSLCAQNTDEKPIPFSVEFKVSDTLLKRIPEIDNFYQFEVKIIGAQGQKMLENVTVKVVADNEKSSLLEKTFGQDFLPRKLGMISKETTHLQFYFKLKKEAAPMGEEKAVLKIVLVDSTGKTIEQDPSIKSVMTIRIPGNSQLNDYNYLAYVGTNFDLVDGIKAKHLFFATNIFLHPRPIPWSCGLSVGLYGNRTFMASDSIKGIRRLYQSVGSGDTITDYYVNTYALRNQISDNIGATFSPLIKLGCLSSADNIIRVYFAPTVEFIWRRVQMDMKYDTGTPSDTSVRQVSTPFYGTLTPPDQIRISYNEYVFNFGGGVFITHETDKISVRVGAFTGYQHRYIPGVTSSQSTQLADPVYSSIKGVCFGGRMWITDNASGITIQAEITNTLQNSRPYYGVTLSKAITYSKLGSIFQPLSSR